MKEKCVMGCAELNLFCPSKLDVIPACAPEVDSRQSKGSSEV